MSGIVVVAGVFQPGSVVTLYVVPDERVLRPEGHDVVGQRLVDENGNVGWDGLEVDARYLVTGYVSGNYVIVRARGVDAEAPDTELIQPPVQPSPQMIGTQEAPDPGLPTPEPPATDQPLPVGLPESVQTNVLGTAPGEAGAEQVAQEAAQAAAVEQPPPTEQPPAQPDVAAGAAGTVPSESAGTAEQAGAPSKQEPSAAPAGAASSGGAAAEQPAAAPSDQPAQPAADAAAAADQPAAPAAEQPPA